jgi:NADPH:quinone reductase-like Zn-dependent oxidoreductase
MTPPIDKTMEANVIGGFGGPVVIEYNTAFPVTKPGPGEVLISVKASTVNPIDCRVRQGYGHRLFAKKRGFDFPYILGSELSGIVVRTGVGVQGLAEGDAVIAAVGPTHQGTNAAYCTVPYALCVDKPTTLSFSEAATLPYSALTIAAAFAKARLNEQTTANKRVLVHGGTGGIGTIAIPWLKAWGATVATTASTKNLEFARQIGADHVIDYKQEDFSALLSNYDVVLDTVGGDYEARSIPVLAAGGCYVTLVTPALNNIDKHGIAIGLMRSIATMIGNKRRFKKHGLRYEWAMFTPNRDALQLAAILCEQKKIIPRVRCVYPLMSLADAHREQETNSAPGRIVITHG